KSNEPRARAIGFSPFRYKLVAFVLAGGACGLAGALLANQTEYLTPEFMHWTRSGEIMFMVILGGMGTLFGPVLGAIVLLGLEDDLRPDAGMTRFAGQDVTSLDAPTRSRLGLARSFQITSIFRDFTAVDNVALAVQAHSGHSFRFWRPARAERALRDPALAVLDSVGLGDRADVLAANLAHGEQRQLEIAMALATRPRLLLLDEPVAGMGLEESQRMVRL